MSPDVTSSWPAARRPNRCAARHTSRGDVQADSLTVSDTPAHLAVHAQRLWVVRDHVQRPAPAADVAQSCRRGTQQPRVAARLHAQVCKGAGSFLQLLHVRRCCTRLATRTACSHKAHNGVEECPSSGS
jgi:hypothetical protein